MNELQALLHLIRIQTGYGARSVIDILVELINGNSLESIIQQSGSQADYCFLTDYEVRCLLQYVIRLKTE